MFWIKGEHKGFLFNLSHHYFHFRISQSCQECNRSVLRFWYCNTFKIWQFTTKMYWSHPTSDLSCSNDSICPPPPFWYVEWEGCGMKWSWTSLIYHCNICLVLCKTTRNLNQNSWSPSWEANPGTLEYDIGALTTTLQPTLGMDFKSLR
jgi:hypothetical protein